MCLMGVVRVYHTHWSEVIGRSVAIGLRCYSFVRSRRWIRKEPAYPHQYVFDLCENARASECFIRKYELIFPSVQISTEAGQNVTSS